jgi:hypothetical protein
MGLDDEELQPKPKKKKKRKVAPGAAAKPDAAEREATESPEAESPAAEEPAADRAKARGSELSTKISASVSLAAAVLLAVVANIYVGRHFTRWDFTKGGEFTLSTGTVETLRGLDSEVSIFVLLPRGDATGISVAEILDTYSVHTDKLKIEFVDPDRDQERLFELRKKYGLLSNEVGGRVEVNAAMVVVKGDSHRYVLESEFYKVEDAEDMRVRPRLEYAITSAIRQVRAEKKTTVCFTTGHGELPLEAGGLEGMAEVRQRLLTNNYDVQAVFDPADTRAAPLADCNLLVVAAPRAPVPPDHAQAMKDFIEKGGDALIVVWPVPEASRKSWVKLGLDEVIATAGVRVDEDIVFEGEPAMRGSRGDGTIFFASPLAHPVTSRLIEEEQKGITASLAFASSIIDSGSALKPEPLLQTSKKSFGAKNYWNRSEADRDLTPTASDNEGPLTIASATERPKLPGKDRGARVVVIASAVPLWGATLTTPELYGTSLFTDGAISWLAGHEQFLDIPDKPIKTTGLRLTEEALTQTFRYVVVLIPFLTAVAGIFIFYRRRVRKAAKVKA